MCVCRILVFLHPSHNVLRFRVCDSTISPHSFPSSFLMLEPIDFCHFPSGHALFPSTPTPHSPSTQVGHSTVAIRLNGSLHVCESTDKNGFPPYWPPPYGIRCHPWLEWLDLAEKAGYVVSLLPLSPERQKMFNETRAEEFVKSAIGLPYG